MVGDMGNLFSGLHFSKNHPHRHPGESRGPVAAERKAKPFWIPAFAGMTGGMAGMMIMPGRAPGSPLKIQRQYGHRIASHGNRGVR